MKKRESNMELLRIISILLIIIFHCAYKSGFVFEQQFTMNEFIIKSLWMLGELGVNMFVLISGYFMINSKFKWKKLFLLLIEVLFYHFFTIFISLQLGIFQYTGLRSIFMSFFPIIFNNYWFITAYVIVYVLSPYLNIFIFSLDKITYKKFLFTLLFLYSVIPTLFGVFVNTTEGFLFYNRLIWLLIVYFTGAYIKLYSISFISSFKKSILVILTSFSVLIGSILIIEKLEALFSKFGTTEIAYLWPPNSLPMFFASVGLFGVFMYLKLPYSRIINFLGSTTLGIYLLYDGYLSGWLWHTMFKCTNYQSSKYLIFYIIFSAIVIFTVGVIIDFLRQILEKHIIKKALDSKIMTKF
ncbi:MAG: acyltransferase family protein [Bacilli bacterium]